MRLVVPLGPLVALLLALPAAAQAVVLHTSPSGAGASCTAAAPCSLATALLLDANGDEIRLSADEYWLNAPIEIDRNNITLSGPPGRYAPSDFRAFLIFRAEADGAPGGFDATTKIEVYGNGFRMERVSVVGRANGSYMVAADQNPALTGTRLNRVYISDDGTTTGTLVADDVAITNSVIRRTKAGCIGFALNVTGTITGSTVTSTCGAIVNSDAFHDPATGDSCQLQIRNTISVGVSYNLQASKTGGPGGCTPATTYATSWIPASGTGGGILNPGGFVTAGAGNLPSTPPAIPDAFGDPFTMPLTAPAVNAGCTGAECGTEDFYGRPRPIGSANDIGAVEAFLPPAVSPVTVGAITATGAALSATVNPNGGATTYAFEIRKAGGASWTSIGGATTGDGAIPVDVGAEARALDADTAYEVRLTGTNPTGEATSASVTAFRTAAPARPRTSVSSVRARVTRTNVRISSQVTVPLAGTITQRATTGSRALVTRCRTSRRASAAGTYPLTCTLGPKGRAALRRAPLRLTLRTVFRATGAAPVTVTNRLTIARRR